MTKYDAAFKWRSEMNAIPTDMIKALYYADLESWREVTAPQKGDDVWHHPSNSSGVILKYNSDKETYRIELEGGRKITAKSEDFDVEHDTPFPMWGQMWSFSGSPDERWLDNPDNQAKMTDCGFRIYEHDEFGYFFGVDSNDIFIDRIWIPLYEARGLMWHKPELEQKPTLAETLKSNAQKSKEQFGNATSSTSKNRGEVII